VATCSRHCPRVHHVQTAADLRPAWFAGVETVGITAGTSTPDGVIDEVERGIRGLGAHPEERASHPDRTFELDAA